MRVMKDSGVEWIGEIPENWGIVKVKQAFVRKNEKAQQENPVVLSLARSGVRVRDVSTNEGQVAESYYNYNPVSVGDLLLNPMDLYSGANCSLSEVEGVISPAYVNLKNKEGYFSKFYDYYFKVQYWMMVLFAHGKGVSFDNRWTLNHETLMNFPIVSPDFKTQKHIADFLDDKCGKIDRYIEKQQQIIDKLKEYKQAVITEAVTKGLDPDAPMKDSGIEWIGMIPEHWEISRVGLLCDIVLGKMLCALPLSEEYTLERYFCAADVHFDGVSQNNEIKKMWFSADEKEMYRVKIGDLLIVEGGAGAGGCAIVKKLFESTYVQNSIMIVRSTKSYSNYYLRYLIESYVKRGYIDFVCNKATIPHFTKDKLSHTLTPIMSINEMNDISNYLDKKCFKIDSEIAKYTSVIEKLTEYKKSLIYEAVTGKLEV